METIKVWNDSPSEKQLEYICNVLDKGGLLVYPTDTLYAIGCDALNSKAIEKICHLKNINPDKSHLSIICSDISQAAEYSRIDNHNFKLIKENTPGAFTFLLPTVNNLPKAFKRRKTVGIRIPECNTATMIAEKLGHPIMTSSIYFDNEDEAISPGLIAEKYDNVANLMIEGEEGTTDVSTIVDCTVYPPEILRQGKAELLK